MTKRDTKSRYVGNHVACLLFMFCHGRLAMPSVRHGLKARHFPFPRRSGGPQLEGAGEGSRNMSEENDSVPQAIKPMPRDKDGLIWHFTSVDALPKILLGEDGLWAGHASFMSDPMDCALINRNRAIEVGAFADYISLQHEKGLVDEAVKNEVQEWNRRGEENPTFITCLTPVTDEPQRWIETTRDGGYAIGFDASLLENLLKSDENVIGDNCSYFDYEDKLSTIVHRERTLVEIENAMRSNNYDKNAIIARLYELLKNCFTNEDDFIFKKRPSLEWEKEYRIACSFKEDIPNNRLRFINGKPFVTLALSVHICHCVRRIKVSPLGNIMQARIEASMVARAIGLTREAVSVAPIKID